MVYFGMLYHTHMHIQWYIDTHTVTTQHHNQKRIKFLFSFVQPFEHFFGHFCLTTASKGTARKGGNKKLKTLLALFRHFCSLQNNKRNVDRQHSTIKTSMPFLPSSSARPFYFFPFLFFFFDCFFFLGFTFSRNSTQISEKKKKTKGLAAGLELLALEKEKKNNPPLQGQRYRTSIYLKKKELITVKSPIV